jgi:hypothetical protein
MTKKIARIKPSENTDNLLVMNALLENVNGT